MTNLDRMLKSRHYSADKGPSRQGFGLPSGHVRLWELDQKEGRAPKNWCFRIVVLEKTPESLLDGKDIKPVYLKGNQPWILIGRTDADAEAEAPVFWSLDANSRLIEKVPDAGRDWGQKKKRASEDEMAGRHHWCNGHKLGQTSRGGEEPGGLACCGPWGCKQLDTPGQLRNNNIFMYILTLGRYCQIAFWKAP